MTFSNCNVGRGSCLTFVLSVALAATYAHAQRDKPTPEEIGNATMAESIAQLGQMAVSHRAITPETLRQSIALLKAANRLNPNELRFARLLAEAALQTGDVETAITAYQSIHRLDPDDRLAQIRLVDLYLGKMETADARLRYLATGDPEKQRKGLYESESVPSEVRSHAAFLASQVYLERAQTSEALQMLEESLRLSPVNPDALRLKYELVGDDGEPHVRVALLLQMLRSNPAQQGVMAKIAHELADVGMQEESLNWYNGAFNLAGAVGRGVTNADFGRFAAQLIVAGNAPTAQQLAMGMLERNARDVDAALVNLLVQRRSGDEEKHKLALAAAEQALIGRAQNVGQQLRGEPVTTQPSETVQVDVPGDIKRLLEVGDPNLTAMYASTLADLAWLRAYFQENPQEAAQVIQLLRHLLPADSVTLARLEGWTYLVAGQTQEAQSKLSAVAERDPLAQLGMIRLTEKDNPDRATQEARRLMEQNPSGLLGAIIHDALRDKKVKRSPGQPPPLTPDAEAVKAELDAFPQDWMNFISRPQDFYAVRAEPLRINHEYGEPIVARVVVTNIGKHDITVGPDGAIRPDLWFDVQVRGAMQDFVPGVAFDRLGRQVVLKPGQITSQTVRVDQGRLGQMLQSHASATLPLYYFIVTNPLSTSVNIGPGPGGQRQSFFKPIQRTGLNIDRKNLNNTLLKLLTELTGGTTQQKLRAVQSLAWFAQQFARVEEEEVRARAGDVLAAMHKATDDRNAHVRAWAGYMIAILPILSPERRRSVIDGMLEDTAWETRLLGVYLVQSLEPQQWEPIAGPVAQSDPEPLVRELAAAVVDFADNPAATQPVGPPPGEDENAPDATADPVSSGTGP